MEKPDRGQGAGKIITWTGRLGTKVQYATRDLVSTKAEKIPKLLKSSGKWIYPAWDQTARLEVCKYYINEVETSGERQDSFG